MEEKLYRVILEGIGQNSEEERLSFCSRFSEKYGLPLQQLINIAQRSPIVIKKDIPFKKAERLAKALEQFGASVSIERRRSLCPIALEPHPEGNGALALESAMVRRTSEGYWQVLGKVKNISPKELNEVWALIQALDEHHELLAFEEIPLPFDPLPLNASAPFKALFERDLPVKTFGLAFKTASGSLLSVKDSRKRRDWVEVPFTIPKPMAAQEDREKGVEEAKEVSEMGPDIFQAEWSEEEKKEDLYSAPSQDRREEEILVESPGEGPIPREDSGRLEGHQKEELRLDVTEEEMEGPFQTPVRIDGKGSAESLSDLKLLEPGESSTYPWLEAFRRTVEEMDPRSKDPFLSWYRTLPREKDRGQIRGFLLAALIYARFNQSHLTSVALDNTQKVFPPTLQEEISEKDIPVLQGDLFFPPEVWRELYIRAIPRLKEVANRILEREGWKTTDLDRLIRTIPHMTGSNSRWVIRLLHDEAPEIVPDISDLEVDVQEGLFRVAARLGVVHPLFDLYQGKGSMGDKKIQAFARIVFPEDPLKIEDPLKRIGAPEGFCLPTQPLCSPCPMVHFCPKHFTDIDPAEKGMVWKPL
ncbi:MAG: hypothetical protein N3G78_01090 [Desulfobacterota bacterium]|nr:hypothetical protein [Thermodesulfobacteriota bacterium]